MQAGVEQQAPYASENATTLLDADVIDHQSYRLDEVLRVRVSLV